MTDQIPRLLDQIDRLDRDATTGPWQFDDEENEMIRVISKTSAYTISEDIGVRVDGDVDAEFIALARTALPQLAKAVKSVLEFLEHRVHPSKTLDPTGEFGAILDAYDRTIRQVITDALGDDDE